MQICLLPESEALDSWEDEVATTPEDEVRYFHSRIVIVKLHIKIESHLNVNQFQQEADELGEGMKQPMPIKKKSPTIEENKSKREHVNVVFIGHVG